MLISKKLSLTIALVCSISSAMELHAGADPKASHGSKVGRNITMAMMGISLIGSHIVATGISKLRIANQLEKEILKPESLRILGFRNIGVGLSMMFPFCSTMTIAHAMTIKNKHAGVSLN